MGESDEQVTVGPGQAATSEVGPTTVALMQVIESTPDCVKLVSATGTLLYLNDSGRRALGVDGTLAPDAVWVHLLPEDIRVAAQTALAAARAGEAARFPGRSVAAEGTVTYWDNMLSPVAGTDAVLCVSRDVTGERHALEALQASEERLAIALRVGGMGVWDYDIVEDRLTCDEQWYRIMGRDPRRPVRSMADFQPFVHPEDRQRATEVEAVAAELVASDEDYAIEFRIVRPDGEVRWVRSAAHIEHVDGTPRRAVGFVVDITEARRRESELRDAHQALVEERTVLSRQSLEDPLTGVPNRRHLDGELHRVWERAQRSASPICVAMIDVDHFKEFNDRYGHAPGDDALRRVAGALRSTVRGGDLVARYGGEEFACLLVDSPDPAQVLDRLVRAVSDLAIAHEAAPAGCVTISCGAVVAHGSLDLTSVDLLRASDAALYEAKAAGRNRVALHRLGPADDETPPLSVPSP